MAALADRIKRGPDRRETELPVIHEQRETPERREFMAPWRKRSIEQAGGRFVAVAWREVAA